MTTLLTWLTSHHMHYRVIAVHSHALLAMHRTCAAHHALTAFAVYGAHAVTYCYGH